MSSPNTTTVSLNSLASSQCRKTLSEHVNLARPEDILEFRRGVNPNVFRGAWTPFWFMSARLSCSGQGVMLHLKISEHPSIMANFPAINHSDSVRNHTVMVLSFESKDQSLQMIEKILSALKRMSPGSEKLEIGSIDGMYWQGVYACGDGEIVNRNAVIRQAMQEGWAHYQSQVASGEAKDFLSKADWMRRCVETIDESIQREWSSWIALEEKVQNVESLSSVWDTSWGLKPNSIQAWKTAWNEAWRDHQWEKIVGLLLNPDCEPLVENPKKEKTSGVKKKSSPKVRVNINEALLPLHLQEVVSHPDNQKMWLAIGCSEVLQEAWKKRFNQSWGEQWRQYHASLMMESLFQGDGGWLKLDQDPCAQGLMGDHEYGGPLLDWKWNSCCFGDRYVIQRALSEVNPKAMKGIEPQPYKNEKAEFSSEEEGIRHWINDHIVGPFVDRAWNLESCSRQDMEKIGKMSEIWWSLEYVEHQIAEEDKSSWKKTLSSKRESADIVNELHELQFLIWGAGGIDSTWDHSLIKFTKRLGFKALTLEGILSLAHQCPYLLEDLEYAMEDSSDAFNASHWMKVWDIQSMGLKLAQKTHLIEDIRDLGDTLPYLKRIADAFDVAEQHQMLNRHMMQEVPQTNTAGDPIEGIQKSKRL